ncbi:MAG: 1-deoxy-D-xylulose-5-phosphate reductoisomerase [Armatimonadetes bacterium]|nr:1-deoxy-D-xylulose-5-phosphate reductoisomerase [Armatimonadota bacterium]MDW8121430.1 1-deoxy-D-xylulose-5-phosphate reductoisomerase [Armatimonadota bacterium]
MIGVSILGCTGSIGSQTLEVIGKYPDRLRVVCLAAHKDFSKMAALIQRWRPELVAMVETSAAQRLRPLVTAPVLLGEEGIEAAATHPTAQIVVVAMPTSRVLKATLRALQAGKRVALATKEVMVTGGCLVKEQLTRSGSLIPIDSEHSALFQCLLGENSDGVERLILTASGGPFWSKPLKELEFATVEQALAHPTWKMGPKVTIDSATLMNKGLEILEAQGLFGIPADRIDVLIHPQSIVHSLVEFRDGSVKAQLSVPDMRLPIQYALLYPQRLPSLIRRLNLSEVGSLTFYEPDPYKFPSLALARHAATLGGTMPTVLNAANEVAVAQFLSGRIRFLEIVKIVEATMNRHQPEKDLTLEKIEHYDHWARRIANEEAGKRYS